MSIQEITKEQSDGVILAVGNGIETEKSFRRSFVAISGL